MNHFLANFRLPSREPLFRHVRLGFHVENYVGFHGGVKKINPNGKACPLGFILGDFLGLCRANVGPFWDYVGFLCQDGM